MNFISSYDDEKDQVTSYQKIYLEDLDRIEIGLYSTYKKWIIEQRYRIFIVVVVFLVSLVHGNSLWCVPITQNQDP